MVFGPGIAQGNIVNKPVEQIDIAKTIGQLMGFASEMAEGKVLADAFL